MLIKIPLDIWRHVFDFLGLSADRRQLARKLNEIDDRQFSDICQKWLHEWTKDVSIGDLHIYSIGEAPRMERCDWHQMEEFSDEVVSFAETELPDNIRNFREIILSFVDTTVLQFLRRMQPLFHDVSLYIECSYGDSVEAEQTALGYLMPLLMSGSIHTIKLYKHQLLLAIRRQFPAQLLAVKHLHLDMDMRSVQISCECIELLVTWLGTRCADGEPRTLTIWNTYQIHHQMPTGFIQPIRQQFLDAKQPCSFFICFIILTHYEAIPGSTTQNAITSEQLIIRPRGWLLSIGRCPAELDGQQWMEEMGGKCRNGLTQMKQRNISIFFPGLGQIDEAKLLVKEEGAGEQEEDFDQQPGPSSKKSKLTS